MSQSSRHEIEAYLTDLRRLLSGQEPHGLDPYLAVPDEKRHYHRGTAAPIVGRFVQRPTGVWVPEGARLASDPIDNARTYIAWNEISDLSLPSFPFLHHALLHNPVKDALHSVAMSMCELKKLDEEDSTRALDTVALDFFTEPTRGRLARRIKDGSVIHAPQLLMVLAKMILRFCPDDVAQSQVVTVPLPMLLMMVADYLSPTFGASGQEPTVEELTLELAANSHFNSSLRIDSHLAQFQRRWIEMPSEAPSKFLPKAMTDIFQEATGDDLRDQVATCFAVYTGAVQGKPVIDAPQYFAQVNWARERYQSVLDRISMSIDDYRGEISKELTSKSVDWHFSTFDRYPLIRSGDQYLVLDPERVLKRSVGFLPYFDIEEGFARTARKSMNPKVRRALDDYGERYVGEVLGSIARLCEGASQVYTDSDFRRVFKDQRIADFAVRFGSDWVVVEVTTSQARRDTIHAVSTGSLLKDIELIVDEAEQVAETINSMRHFAAALTRE
jgi:hypothetical protein